MGGRSININRKSVIIQHRDNRKIANKKEVAVQVSRRHRIIISDSNKKFGISNKIICIISIDSVKNSKKLHGKYQRKKI